MNTGVFRKLTYGLYVIASKKENKLNGQIANTVFQISSQPYTIAISINKNNLTHEFIKDSKVFSVSILSDSAPMSLIGHFGFKSGRDIDKFSSVSYKEGTSGVPVLSEYTIGYLEAEVINSIDVETHTVFIGKVINAESFTDEEPMTYANYHLIKKGVTPVSSPTYIREKAEDNINIKESKKEDDTMKKYQCTVCGYIYDPEKGDPDSGIAPGTPFENLPGDWVCPLCGVAKDQFEEV